MIALILRLFPASSIVLAERYYNVARTLAFTASSNGLWYGRSTKESP